jgi:hypothetical protein
MSHSQDAYDFVSAIETVYYAYGPNSDKAGKWLATFEKARSDNDLRKLALEAKRILRRA